MKKLLLRLLVLSMLMTTAMSIDTIVVHAASDEYDGMREKWVDYLTGGTGFDLNDPIIAPKIAGIGTKAQGYWNSMDKSAGRTYLWSDLPDNSNSSFITSQYSRLYDMALAYSQYGSALYQNTSLLADVIGGLEWMDANRYYPGAPRATDYNWWNYQIGSAYRLLNCAILLFDHLTPAQVARYVAAVDYYTPVINLTAANRLSQAEIVMKSGILSKDAGKMTAARDGLDDLYLEVTAGAGMYADGSFIQHHAIGYNGGYGSVYIQGVLKLVDTLRDTAWEVINPNVNNLYKWVYGAYEPVLYKGGGFMSMVRGRFISYSTPDSGARERNDYMYGLDAVRGILLATQTAPNSNDRLYFKQMIKEYVQTNWYQPVLAGMPIYELLLAQQIYNDSTIAARGDLITHKKYPVMDSVVHARPGYMFGLSMFSDRTFNYESINKENLHGWFTNYGATYLYNDDQAQYNGNYWATIDPYRIPGTTVDKTVRPDYDPVQDSGGKRGYLQYNNNKSAWVGGTAISGLYGASGMHLQDVGSSTLEAKKSWFMFDDEIVALGTDINSMDNSPIETIVENRALTDTGDNALTLNGSPALSGLGQSMAASDVEWIHLQGNVPDSDIGYYFPDGTALNLKREQRTGTFYDINQGGIIDDNRVAVQTRNYMTMWYEHGSNPVNAEYKYVLLPDYSTSQVAAYNQNPQIEILANNADIQAVKETTLNIVAANFWNNETNTVDMITSNTKSSVMTRMSGTTLDISLSDPTMRNTGTVNVVINKAGQTVVSKDPEVTVVQLNPIVLSVDVNQAKGKSFHAQIETDPQAALLPAPVLAPASSTMLKVNPTDDAYVRDGSYADYNFAFDPKLDIKSMLESAGTRRKAYLKFNFGDLEGASASSAKLRFYVPGVNTDPSRTMKLYGTSDKSWYETGITWNNAPAGTAYIGSQDISNTAGVWYEMDVTDYINANLTDEVASFLLTVEGPQSSTGNFTVSSRQDPANMPELIIYTTAKLNPTEDTFVRDGQYADTAYGDSPILDVKTIQGLTDFKRKAYIKFDFSHLSTTPGDTARLRFYVPSVNTDPSRAVKLYGTADKSWHEAGTTWNNAPAGTTYIGSLDISNTAGVWYEMDVTDYVNANMTDKVASFLLVIEDPASGNDNFAIASRESAANKPELIISPPIKFNPTDDAFVRDGQYANSNYGANPSLEIKSINGGTDFKRKAYMKFDFGSFGADTVSSAKLKLHVPAVNTDPLRTVKLYGTADKSWSQAAITWNNAPAGTAYIGSRDISNTAGVWYEFDVTDYINSNMTEKAVSFLLAIEDPASAKDNFFISSNESAANRPELIIVP